MFNIQTTQQDKVKENLKKIDEVGSFSLDVLLRGYKNSYNLFWFNADVSPQELCDLMGTSAYLLFKKHKETGEYLKTQIEGFEELGIPENYEVEMHQDGTVTITEVELEEIIEE